MQIPESKTGYSANCTKQACIFCLLHPSTFSVDFSTEAMRLIFSRQLRCMARKPVFMVPKKKVGSILVSVCP